MRFTSSFRLSRPPLTPPRNLKNRFCGDGPMDGIGTQFNDVTNSMVLTTGFSSVLTITVEVDLFVEQGIRGMGRLFLAGVTDGNQGKHFHSIGKP